MKYNYLYGTPYEIEQGKQMYHFNSDTEFLGRMLEIREGDSVLDVGTNNGALLCYIAARKGIPSGIDLFEEVVDLARRNMEHNQIQAQIYTCPLQKFSHEPFDHVICNPPYFPTRKECLKSTNPYLRAARHEEYLSLEELFRYTFPFVKEYGSLQIVHRASRLEEIVQIASEKGFYLRKKRYSCVTEGGEKRSVWCFFEKKKGPCITYSPSYLDDRSSVDRKEVLCIES